MCAYFIVNSAKIVFSGSCSVQALTVSGNFLVLREMAEELTLARVDSERERSGMERFVSSSADLSGGMMCVEYTSALVVKRIAKLEGLVRARHEKHKRRRDEDLYLLEGPTSTRREKCKRRRDEDLCLLEQNSPGDESAGEERPIHDAMRSKMSSSSGCGAPRRCTPISCRPQADEGTITYHLEWVV